MKHARTPNIEWGSKARKAEDRERGLNAKDRRDSIAEQLDEQLDAYHCDRNGTQLAIGDKVLHPGGFLAEVNGSRGLYITGIGEDDGHLVTWHPHNVERLGPCSDS